MQLNVTALPHGAELGNEIMLTSLVITIETPTEMSLPVNLGRASHQLLLSLLPPALATELHESQQTKPFTVSTLVMRAGQGRGDFGR